ncbi:MAG: TPM domain-containing protein [Thermodesulfobacteriota bacterium]
MVCYACSGDSEQQTGQGEKLIIDDAGIVSFSPDIMEQYREYNSYLLDQFDIDFRVMTTDSEQDINSFTNEAYDTFQQESRSTSGRALLLVINTRLDETRVGVSMALEPIYTDAFVSYVERKGMVPYFRDSRVSDGVYMMMELVKDRALEAEQGKEYMGPMETKTLGGGARNDALIGRVDPTAKQGENLLAEESDTPEDIFAKHVMGLKTHNKNPNLDIFSEATRTFFQEWTVTDINIDNEYRFISQCHDGKVIYSDDETRAVIFHPLEQRTCCPYYFVKEQGKWRLDIFTMAKVVRFNTDMQWHFSRKEREKYNIPYEFVFGEFVYDKNGYPYFRKKKLRWGYRCSDYSLPGAQPEKNLCLISWLARDGVARNELGLQINDIIVGIGDEGYQIENPGIYTAAGYFDMPAGELVTLTVERKGVGSLKLQTPAP